MHLCFVLYGMYSIYGLIIDGHWMGIVMVIVEDDTSKSRTTNMCLNWDLTWQPSLRVKVMPST